MNEQSANTQPPKFSIKPIYKRRDLLPIWIKVFVWVFFLFGAAVPIALVFGALKIPFELSLYGLQTKEVFSGLGLSILALFALKSIVSYALWTGKEWAITIGKVDAVIGLLICILVLFPLLQPKINLRLEPVLLIPYLVKLRNLNNDWKNFYVEANETPVTA